MLRFQIHYNRVLTGLVFSILLINSACNLPGGPPETSIPPEGTPAQTLPPYLPPETTSEQDRPTSTLGISDPILTSAAATISAHLTSEAGKPAPGIPEAIMTSAAATISSQLTESAPPEAPQQPGQPTQDLAPIPPTATSTRTPYPTSSPTNTLIPYTPNPTLSYGTGGLIGSGFNVRNVNLHACRGIYSANLYIYNKSGAAFESLLMQINDLTTSQVLNQTQSDFPFMTTDRTCLSGGIERLASGYSLYIGSSMILPNLSGHSIQIDVKLCAQNGLAGSCYLQSVIFVVP